MINSDKHHLIIFILEKDEMNELGSAKQKEKEVIKKEEKETPAEEDKVAEPKASKVRFPIISASFIFLYRLTERESMMKLLKKPKKKMISNRY